MAKSPIKSPKPKSLKPAATSKTAKRKKARDKLVTKLDKGPLF